MEWIFYFWNGFSIFGKIWEILADISKFRPKCGIMRSLDAILALSHPFTLVPPPKPALFLPTLVCIIERTETNRPYHITSGSSSGPYEQ